MPTLLADPPAAPTEQQPAAGSSGGAETPQPETPQALPRSCSKCGSPLAAGQDWCLQCGTGGPDSLRTRTPSWRSAAVLLGALAILVAGAATAAYAALSKGGGAARATTTVAQVPAPAATAPVTPATPPASGTAPGAIGTPTTVKPALPLGAVKAPKIPLSTPTPKSTISPSTSGGSGTPTTTTPKTSNGVNPVAGEAHPDALLLDTNAAATYNPYNYAATNFGDPSLAIDGDNSTGWTAIVDPSVAPKMAEGLLVDLNTPRKLSALGLTTSTPGLTAQVYGAVGQAPPTSITDSAWVALSPARVVAKKHVRIKLGGASAASKAAHRFVVVWLSEAPASALGTPEAPGRVSINEVELFPLKK